MLEQQEKNLQRLVRDPNKCRRTGCNRQPRPNSKFCSVSTMTEVREGVQEEEEETKARAFDRQLWVSCKVIRSFFFFLLA